MGRSVAYSDFVALFEQCNQAIWPIQLVGQLAMLVAIAMMFTSWRYARSAIFGTLAPFCIFIEIVFQYTYLRPLYQPGKTFAGLWMAEGMLLAFSASRPPRCFKRSTGWCAALGWLAIGYSLMGYPALGFLLRSSVLRIAWPGAFPCPTALFTLGVLVMEQGPLPKWMLVIPAFWAIGGLVPFSWGIREDLGLVVFGMLIVVTIVSRDRSCRRPASATGLCHF
jgi:hypothetical protein